MFPWSHDINETIAILSITIVLLACISIMPADAAKEVVSFGLGGIVGYVSKSMRNGHEETKPKE